MSYTGITTLALVLLLPILLAQNTPSIIHQPGISNCARQCLFRFCRFNQAQLFGAPLKSNFPTICRRNQDISRIISVGEASIKLPNNTQIPISQWRPDGLNPPLPKRHFKIRPVFGEENSGLVVSPARGNQNEFVNERCFLLPILKYERKFGNSVRVVNTKSRSGSCLAFTSRTRDVMFEAQWFSGDDFDLEIVEPDGEVLGSSNRNTVCGMFVRDINVDACDLVSMGTELASYNRGCSGFQRGEYQAVLRHTDNCGKGPSKWEIRVSVAGRLRKTVTGISDGSGGTVAGRMTFRL